MFAPSPDIRIAGWGVLFSGIFIISLVIIGVYLFKYRKNKYTWIVVSLLFLLFVPIIFVPYLFWARYYPHLFVLPVIALIILFKCMQNKIISLLVVLLLLNSIPQMVSTVIIRLGQSVQIRREFREFNERAEGRTALVQTVQFNDFFNGVFINMRDAGIDNFIFYYYDFPYEFEGTLFVGFATLGYVFLPN